MYSKDGDDAPLLYLSASSQLMECNQDGIAIPGQVIDLTAKVQNAFGDPNFTFTGHYIAGGTVVINGIPTTDGNNLRKLKSDNWQNTFSKIVVQATVESPTGLLTDILTIHKITDGENSILSYLTNENITLREYPDTATINLTPATGEFRVHDGKPRITDYSLLEFGTKKSSKLYC